MNPTTKNERVVIERDRSVGRVTTGTTIAMLATAAVLLAAVVGCGPTFDPPSLIEKTRVVGARVEVAGDASRATPRPGETATVTWLVTAPAEVPPLQWAFALCVPEPGSALGCQGQPLAIFQGSDSPPRIAVPVPEAGTLGNTKTLVLYGRICGSSSPVFDPDSGYPSCSDGGAGTTASVSLRVQTGDPDTNHNPTIDRGLSLDGQPWPAAAADSDPCLEGGPRVTATADDHLIDIVTVGSDRESFVALVGDPPVSTRVRESLQISQFTTAGKFKSPYSFVEADDTKDETTVQAKWKAPVAKDVSTPTAVTFTFVARDGRGGTDWTRRSLCVVP